MLLEVIPAEIARQVDVLLSELCLGAEIEGEERGCQLTTKHLLCARDSAGPWRDGSEQASAAPVLTELLK